MSLENDTDYNPGRETVKDRQDDTNVRGKKIMKVSVIGIAANIVLSILKYLAGIVTDSVSMRLDAVNNLSDTFSSIVTIVGTMIATKPADKDHPLGHGRYEYLAAIVVAAVIVLAGVGSFAESITKIMSPTEMNYTLPAVFVMIFGIVVKLILGRFTTVRGKEYKSQSLRNSGEDATFDAVVTFSTIISMAVYLVLGINIDGYVGAVISVLIARSGLEMIMEATSELIGKRVDAGLSKSVKKFIASHEGVLGAYDLFIDNYGPDDLIGSVHIEVPDTMDAHHISDLTREIENGVFLKFGIFLTVGIYAVNTKDKTSLKMRKTIEKMMLAHECVRSTHGFYVDERDKDISIDVVTDFSVKDKKKLREGLLSEIKEKYPDYKIKLVLDAEISD